MTYPWQGAADPRDLSETHFRAAAERLRCGTAEIRAIWEVEAAGQHYLRDGSVIRRFEPHHVPRDWWPGMGFALRSGEAPWRASLRIATSERERMLAEAYGRDPETALRATSWGAPQIMGFNAAAAGFGSAASMVTHMAAGADRQLGAFVQLIEGWGLASAIRAHDWAAFARRYNGSGQPEEYARRIEAAYRRHAGAASPQVLRVGDRGTAVRELQRALGIEVDGAFGPQTLEAVEAFQRDMGLAVDGVVGARTWAALEAIEARPPKQETPADRITGEVTKYTGAAAAVAAALASVREALPDDAMSLLIGGAMVLGAIAASAWAVRWVRS